MRVREAEERKKEVRRRELGKWTKKWLKIREDTVTDRRTDKTDSRLTARQMGRQ